jgi:hypothetical protein
MYVSTNVIHNKVQQKLHIKKKDQELIGLLLVHNFFAMPFLTTMAL